MYPNKYFLKLWSARPVIWYMIFVQQRSNLSSIPVIDSSGCINFPGTTFIAFSTAILKITGSHSGGRECVPSCMFGHQKHKSAWSTGIDVEDAQRVPEFGDVPSRSCRLSTHHEWYSVWLTWIDKKLADSKNCPRTLSFLLHHLHLPNRCMFALIISMLCGTCVGADGNMSYQVPVVFGNIGWICFMKHRNVNNFIGTYSSCRDSLSLHLLDGYSPRSSFVLCSFSTFLFLRRHADSLLAARPYEVSVWNTSFPDRVRTMEGHEC